jgi:hypothetical protein
MDVKREERGVIRKEGVVPCFRFAPALNPTKKEKRKRNADRRVSYRPHRNDAAARAAARARLSAFHRGFS